MALNLVPTPPQRLLKAKPEPDKRPGFAQDDPASEALDHRVRTRSTWRQRLIEAERGFTAAFRADSTLFAHFFALSMALITAVVLRLNYIEWTLIAISAALGLTADMFGLALRLLWHRSGAAFQQETIGIVRIASAGSLVAVIGSYLAVTVIMVHRIMILFDK